MYKFLVDVEESDFTGNKRQLTHELFANNLDEAWFNAQVFYEYFNSDGTCGVVLKVYPDEE